MSFLEGVLVSGLSAEADIEPDVCSPAERATYVGQRLCFVVFPQFDPIEIAGPSEWTDRSSGRSSVSANS